MVQEVSYWKVLTRRKQLVADGTELETKLNRVLGLFDLTTLGVGSTLGAGVYVLAGQIAKYEAGPSVMISFAIAALASLLAGVCYAEFGARVPKAGSAYVYSYVCIGEFAAFVIGWNLMLEYIIGTASVCRGISLYVDSLLNDTMKETFLDIAPLHFSYVGTYFDFFAFGLVVVFGVALAFGVKTSAMLSNLCSSTNIFILIFVIVAGSIRAEFSNWSIDPVALNSTDIGSGGYFPFGFAGTLKGAATCFFGFVGFDCIATTGEEVRNPRKNIPRSILLSLLIIFLCYFGVSTVLTLMVPYYAQDPNAPLPYAFAAVGWPIAQWIVTIGGIIGLLASLFGALFPLPRVMYSMAQDGLLFRCLGTINHRFQVPVMGSILAAIFTSLIAGFFDLAQLVSLLSIGTLLAYSVVAISVTILRYKNNNEIEKYESVMGSATETTLLTSAGAKATFKNVLRQLCGIGSSNSPNKISTRIVGTLITVFLLLSLVIAYLLMHLDDSILNLVLVVLFSIIAILTLVSISCQPREPGNDLFRVPLVPLLPALSIFINIYLMVQLNEDTWIRFGVWMLMGLIVFTACWFVLGYRHPTKRNAERVAYIKTLQALLAHPNQNSNLGSNGNAKEHCESNMSLNKTLSNGTCLGNELTVRSLDEIHKLSDISDELKEVKHANGKISYIEDTKSSASTATLNQTENVDPGVVGAQITQDEQTAIAMLDDVLQEADDSNSNAPMSPHLLNYGRHLSIDSEFLPGFVETTIVATVHSSSDSSEYNLEDLPEVEAETETKAEKGTAANERYNESKKAAEQMLESLFDSEELIKRIAAKRSVAAVPQNTPNIVVTPLKRASSLASLNSTTSVDDPIHSEQFKNKLSQLFMRPPVTVPVTTLGQSKGNKNSSQQTTNLDGGARDELRSSLKQSKSEADLRQLVMKAIGDSESPAVDDKSTDNGIPRAPKFDPVLYKTINSLKLNKERPSLRKTGLLNELTGVPATKPSMEHELATEDVVPFKTKLEAILKRGPSHRAQQRPDVVVRSPKASPLQQNGAQAVNERLVTRAILVKSQVTNDLNPEEIINNARKSLKPVRIQST